MQGGFGLLGRRGGVAAPTGFVVLIAISMALYDAGEQRAFDARARGQQVDQEVSTGMQVGAYAVAGVGLLVLLIGGGLAIRSFHDVDEDEDDVPVHRGGPPPRGASGGGIDIG
jgi:hypothetical protein